jgi:SPP1 gp7 family putative phage head morphogenesis protein
MQLDKNDTILSRLLENYIRELYDQESVSLENQTELTKYYYEHLSEGLNVGYSTSSLFYDEDLALLLKNDIAIFSAFKETSFRKQLESYLTENGSVVPWSEYKKKAAALNIDYNQRYLKTEYHHTVATANGIDKWKSFEADSDLYPNLKFNAIDDSRTREKHRVLDGLILPINHAFWKTHMTPLDWGCRCDLEQTDEEPSNVIPDFEVKTGFNNNAALSGKIFGEIAYKEGLNKGDIKKAEKLAKQLIKQ